MATIRTRKLRDGSARYTAQIRVTINGRQHSEAKTFGTKKAAHAWARNREAEIERTGIPTEHSKITVADVCGRFLSYLRSTPAGVGRSREQTIEAMSRHPYLLELELAKAGVQDWLGYMERRLKGDELPDGRVIGACGGARLKDDMTYLRTALEHARKVWGLSMDEQAYETAVEMGWDNGMLMVSQARDQRFALDDLDRIMEYWIRPRSGKGAHADTPIPMLLVIPFLIFSTRREAEMCRIRWDDLDRARSRVLVREMKHPRKKRTNDVWVHLPPRALSIIDKMPKVDERIFPYDPRTVGNQFRKARKWAGVSENLRLHDLRHEGISHYFELGYDIPRVAQISGHQSWGMLGRYTHLLDVRHFDKFAGWEWLKRLGIEPVTVKPLRTHDD
jgi:integrase